MRILMVNLPYAGHTNPTLPMTRELVRRGHEVTYVNALNFREKIEQTGAAFVPYLDFPDNLSEEAVKRSCFSAAFRTALSLPGPFDLLVYEMFFYPGIEIARRLGIPCLRQFSQPAWSEATWADAPVFFKLSARLIDMQMMTGREAREMGFGRSCLRDGILGSRPDLNLVYVPEAFQGHRDSFDGTYLFRVPVAEAGSPGQGKGQTEWATLPKPVVYISLGSIISNRGFYRECIRAFGNRPMSVILNTGKIPPETLGRIPENIHAFSFVPQTEVLACTDVFLTHCGMNSVNEALSLGVPMVAMPFINDQITNGKRMEELGLARRVRSFPSSGRELYRAVCEVCADPAYRQRALEMRETILQQGGWDDIIARLEELVKAEKKPIL